MVNTNTPKIKDGQKVEIRLSGEEDDIWHVGTVINARKQWVELDTSDELSPFIADECCIIDWREIAITRHK